MASLNETLRCGAKPGSLCCGASIEKQISIAIRTTLLASLATLALLLGGCGSKPLRPPEADGTYCFKYHRRPGGVCTAVPVPAESVEAEAKQFQPTPGAATVYIVRNRWADAENRVPVSIDGQAPVLTIPYSMLRVRLLPGEHRVAFEWDGKHIVRTFSARAGEILFMELAGALWSWNPEYRWAETDAEGARKRAAASKLIADLDQRR